MLGVQSLCQRLFVHDWPARGIDDVGRWFHLAEKIGVEHPSGLRQERAVNGDEIGDLYQFGELYSLDACAIEHCFWNVGVRSNHAHAEGFGLWRDELWDAPEPDQTQYASSQA